MDSSTKTKKIRSTLPFVVCEFSSGNQLIKQRFAGNLAKVIKLMKDFGEIGLTKLKAAQKPYYIIDMGNHISNLRNKFKLPIGDKWEEHKNSNGYISRFKSYSLPAGLNILEEGGFKW